MAQIVDAGQPGICRPHLSEAEQVAQALGKPRPGIGFAPVMAVPHQRGLRGDRELVLAAPIEVGMHLDYRIVGQGDVARLLKLGLAHPQGALWGGVIAPREAPEFTPTEPGGVEPHEGKAIDLRAER